MVKPMPRVFALSTLNRKLFRDLWLIRGQAFAIIMVVAAGIAMYASMLGTLGGLEDSRRAYYARERFADLFASAKRAPERVADRLAALPGVAMVETRVRTMAVIDLPGVVEPASGVVLSLPDHGEPSLNRPVLRSGRWPAPGSDHEVLLLEPMAEKNGLKPGDVIRATLNGHREALTIAGIVLSPEFVYVLPPGQMAPDDRLFGVVWMRRAALAGVMDMTGAFNDVALALTVDADADALKPQVDRILDPYGGHRSYGRDEQDSNVYLNAEIDGLRSMGRVLPFAFLGVAVFLLHMVTGRILEQERQQIGLIMAFGYRDAAIAWHYGKMVLVIVLIGMAVGTAAGGWIGHGLTALYGQFFRFPYLYFDMPTSVYGTSFLLAVGAGALGVIGAVRRVVRLAPAEAMAPPPPSNYRHGLFERLRPARWAGNMGGMVLRHLIHRPGRAALTWLGLALAMGLNIGSMFTMDAVQVMLSMQFDRLERSDALVTLTDIRERGVVHDFKVLPGVLYAEPMRSVPATLSFGSRHKRLAVSGVPKGSRMVEVIGLDGRALPLPPDGLILSESLADQLRAGPGDRVTVAFDAYSKHTVDPPVVAIASGYIGQAAYMDLAALNRAAGDGDVISGARLAVDDTHEVPLYRALKDRPAVQGVSLRSTLLASVEETIATSFTIMTVAASLFAAVIAVGIIYNEARVTLSERRRELASLRVLGFRRSEVSVVLLAELAILTLLAVPLGGVVGYWLAWLMANTAYQNELLTIPLVIRPHTYGFAAAVLLVSAAVSALLVRRRIDRLDLVAELKTRE